MAFKVLKHTDVVLQPAPLLFWITFHFSRCDFTPESQISQKPVINQKEMQLDSGHKEKDSRPRYLLDLIDREQKRAKGGKNIGVRMKKHSSILIEMWCRVCQMH